MKNIIYTLLFTVLAVSFSHAQKYNTKTGTIEFEASVPSFEEVKATNENVSAILNTETGEFASLALIKGFRFKVALMEEHFNENYMESSDYPKAIVKGKLKDFSMSNLTENFSEFTLTGNITMHGVTKDLETTVNLKMNGEVVEMTTNFMLIPEDFDIKIPKIVSSKVAKEIAVSANYSLSN